MKKEIPFVIVEKVEPIIINNDTYITAKKENDTYYTLLDKDKTSNFYFKILKSKPDNLALNNPPSNPLYVEYMPGTLASLAKATTVIGLDKLSMLIEGWLEYIKKYESVDSIYDGPILKSYKDRFYTEYKILDEDADITPFNLEQQLLLEKYFEHIIENADKYKTEVNEELIEEIKEDSKKLKDSVTTLSKNAVMEKLSSIWAKMQKSGLPVIKEFFIAARKEFFSFIFKEGSKLLE